MRSIFDDIRNAINTKDILIQLIIINVVVWLVHSIIHVTTSHLGTSGLSHYIDQYFAIPSDFEEFIFKPWTIITYAFMHQLLSLGHIFFNMLTFYWFGMILADLVGSKKILSVYILGAIAGGFVYLLAYNFLPALANRGPAQMVGASASVTAIVVAAATIAPTYRLNLIFLGPVKIIYIAAFIVIVSYIQSAGSNAGGNIAHLGGALMGYIYVVQLRQGRDWGTPVYIVSDFFKALFSKKVKLKVSHRTDKTTKSNTSAQTPNNFVSQDEIDLILDKISQSGYESLTKEEKQKLFSASQKK